LPPRPRRAQGAGINKHTNSAGMRGSMLLLLHFVGPL